MGYSDSGGWKLFIYPLMIIVALFVIFTLVVNPFISEGSITIPRNNNTLVDGLVNIASYGVPINSTIDFTSAIFPLNLFFDTIVQVQMPIWVILIPSSVKSYLSNSISIFYYMPDIIQMPLVIFIYLSLIYTFYVLIAMMIP